jgi:hypothetical protein
VLVDGAEQIFPTLADPYAMIRTDAPGTDAPTSRSPGLTLNPAEDGAWVNANTTLLYHLGQITIANPILAIPAHAQQDDLNWKAAALEE